MSSAKRQLEPQSKVAAPHVLMIGDKVPDVPMINQDGKTLHFGQFKGKIVLLTFIYTRCPFPIIVRCSAANLQRFKKSWRKIPKTIKKRT